MGANTTGEQKASSSPASRNLNAHVLIWPNPPRIWRGSVFDDLAVGSESLAFLVFYLPGIALYSSSRVIIPLKAANWLWLVAGFKVPRIWSSRKAQPTSVIEQVHAPNMMGCDGMGFPDIVRCAVFIYNIDEMSRFYSWKLQNKFSKESFTY